MELPERFWNKVKMPDDIGKCWLWIGAKSTGGYGKAWDGCNSVYAHRWAFQAQYGSIPSGLQIDHLCSVRKCVNPMHLEAVTSRENTMRGNNFSASHAKKTHCPRGHEYAGDNVRVYRGCRNCVACMRIRSDERKRK